MRTQAEILADLVQHPRLPTPPAVALRVLKIASRSDCKFDEIEEVLRCDPALCGKVLRAVNSAARGLDRTVTSIRTAIRLLGLSAIRSLALSLSIPSMHSRAMPRSLLQRYWRVSVTGALVGRELATRLGRPEPEDDLVAGLLRDLGMLVLQDVWPDRYAEILGGPLDALTLQQCHLEEAKLGVNHALVSAHLLEHWGLPEAIVTPIRFHHDPDSTATQDAPVYERTLLLHFATLIAQLQLVPGDATLIRRILRLARLHFNMGEEQLLELLDPLGQQIDDFAKLIHVDIGKGQGDAQLLLRASEELANLAVQSRLGVRHGTTSSRAGIAAASVPSSADASAGSELHIPAGPTRHFESGKQGQANFVAGTPMNVLEWGCIEHYRLEKLLGRGGMGMVVRGYDMRLHRPVAIKIMLPELAGNAEVRERFAREAEAVAAISHDNVVRIHSIGEIKCMPYLVMEFVAGISLQDRLDMGHPLKIREILNIGRQMAAGLSAAHERRLIHRDIKPANVLIETGTGCAKITDFGVVSLAGDNRAKLTQHNLIVGTPHFMSPEQVQGKPLDHRSDLFSLGTVLYVMSTGRVPFDSDNLMATLRKINEDEPAPITFLNPAAPPWLDELIARLHAKDPYKRFEFAGEVRDVLTQRLQTLSR
jgi:HD-like signal output (HDOD) protein